MDWDGARQGAGLLKSIKFGSVDGRELRADAITPWSSQERVARGGQIRVLLRGSTSPSESVVRLVASTLKALQLRSHESADEPQDEGIPASGT